MLADRSPYGPDMSMFHGPFLIIAALVLALFLAVWFQIYRKAGYSGFLCLLMIVPLVNVLTVLWFAFLAKWPATQRPVA
ncbi:MAG: hypothetical protein AB7L65_01560 [Hyphomonadaceae bacterium]